MSLLLLFGRGGSGPVIEPYPVLQDFALELAFNGSYATEVLSDNPIGFWLLGQQLASSPAEDISGNHRDGTYVGGLTFGTSGPFPHGGTATAFNGTSGYVNVGDVAAFELIGAMSVEFLIKFTSSQAAAYLVGKGFADVPNGWVVAAEFGKLRFSLSTLAGSSLFAVLSPGTYNDGNFHHIVCTWDGTTTPGGAKMYADGVLIQQATASASTPGAPATARMVIGARDVTGSGSVTGYFNGTLTGVAVYNTALTADDVAVHYATLLWADVTEDVLTKPGITLEYGTQGNRPLDRLADTGLLSFSLNNSHTNSGGLAGYYSPNHTASRTGFTHDIPVRVSLTYNSVTRHRFWGRLAMIDPEPGRYRSRATRVVAHDYMYLLADTEVRELPPQLDKTEVELVKAVFDAMPYTAQPTELVLDSSVDAFSYAFYDLQGGRRATTVLNKVITSAWARGFVTGGGTFRLRNRQATIGQLISLVVDDEMMEMDSISDRADVFDQVRAVTHPKSIDATATAVLYSSPIPPFVLPAGGTLEFFADYRHPTNDVMTVGGTAMVTPVSGTDFVANSAEDGSGTNLTANVTVTAEFFASTVKLTLTNNHATLGAYFTTLQVRGKGIYDLAPVTSEVPTGTKNRPLTVDLPYQDDPNTGKALAEFILNERAIIHDPVDSITVSPHRSAALMAFAVECEPSHIISVSETQTGLVEAQAMIRSIRLELQENAILTADIGLIPVMVGDAWELNVDELDTTAVLGYA